MSNGYFFSTPVAGDRTEGELKGKTIHQREFSPTDTIGHIE
jgi:hypothetical protein